MRKILEHLEKFKITIEIWKLETWLKVKNWNNLIF